MNTPTLRFNEFIDEWKDIKIGEIAKFYSGGTPKSFNKEFYKGNIPFIRSGEISSCKTALFINDEAINNSSTRMVNQGDILYALYGATSGEVSISKINGAINQAVLCIKPIYDNNYFIYQFLRKNKEIILKTYLQGGQGNLSGTIVKNIKINIPSVKEQNKLASFLSLVDRRIELQEEKINKLELYKKGIMKKIFDQEIRFKDDNGEEYPEWNFNYIKNLLKYEQPTKYIVKSTEYSNEYNLPVLTANKTFILGYTNEKNGIYTKLPCIIFDDFTLDMKYVEFPYKVKSSAIKILTSKNNDNLKFIFEVLKNKRLIQIGHNRHYISQLQPMKIILPSKIEQKRIAEFLALIDLKIEKENKLSSYLNKLKKGLLQQMFI